MDYINKVFSTKEVESKLGVSTQHIQRLVKDDRVGLVEGVDYRVTNVGTYLYADTAIEKLIAYKEEYGRKKKED